jgi:uncharacterized protein (DUF1810 family)
MSPSAFNLQRFLDAQANHYQKALAEIKNGQKQGHWMWFIFPQIQGLGFSSMAMYYSISNQEEAKAYLSHPVLSNNLIEISNVVLALKIMNPQISAIEIFDEIDAIKLKSSMTLFSETIRNEHQLDDDRFQIFKQILDVYYLGEKDMNTVEILRKQSQ